MTGTLRFILLVAIFDVIAAGAALAVAAATHSSGAIYILAAISAAGIGTFLALGSVWLFQWLRAPVRQRNELRAVLTDLMAQPAFPRVEIISTSTSRTQETLDGMETPHAEIVRIRVPIMVINHELERRVSLDFRLTLYDPDPPEPFARFFSDQRDELPLIVDPEQTVKTTLSFFMELAFFTTPSIRSDAVQAAAAANMQLPTIEERLTVRDHLSKKEIEMLVPGSLDPVPTPPA